jgi:hypothetical protein
MSATSVPDRPWLAWRARGDGSGPVAAGADDLARKRQRKEEKRLAEATRALDSWERYRALVDTVEQGFDLAEMADRKVRFALVVMAGLNVGLFALTTRPELLGLARAPLRGWLGIYLLAYALVGVYFFIQAVEALRPRIGHVPGSSPALRAAPRVPGLRDPEEALRQDVESYARAWREVRFDQLNAELARQSHRIAGINQEKFAALGRLYGGLRVLALMFGGLVVMVGLSTLLGVRP